LSGQEIQPAYLHLADAFTSCRPMRPPSRACGSRPDGDAYYQAALQAYTDQGVSAEDLHALGLSEVDRLTAELELALFEAGLTEGSAAERLTLLSSEPDQIFEATPEGHAALLALMQTYLDKAEAALPSHRLDRAAHESGPARRAGIPGSVSPVRLLFRRPGERIRARPVRNQPLRHDRLAGLYAGNAGVPRDGARPPPRKRADGGDSPPAPDPADDLERCLWRGLGCLCRDFGGRYRTIP
jgi:hypothetical protein